jgi:transaldolase
VDTPEAIEAAHNTMRDLAAAGIDMQAVTRQLEIEGVKSFAESYDQLLQALETRRRALTTA